MNFLAPLGFLSLGSIPVFLWLWRLASSHRQTKVASLIPFEHLIRRTSARRRRLVINWLFWLQLLALLVAALALSQPILSVSRGKTILAILDTSASMSAASGSSTVFEQAKQAMLGRLARKAPRDQVLLMTTAPALPLTPEPVTDGLMLAQLVSAQRAQHLGGQLATTKRLGSALLGRKPDETWVVTDEPQPTGASSASLRWVRVGHPAPNAAIVGVDSLGPLCAATESHVVVTVQSFSDKAISAQLVAREKGRELGKTTVTLASRARQAVTLPLPANTAGVIEISLEAPSDALRVDNRAWAMIAPEDRLPIVVQVKQPALASAVMHWLGACQSLHGIESPPSAGSYLLITDQEGEAPSRGPKLIISGPVNQPAVLSHWVVSEEHAVASYLLPVDVVVAPIDEGSAAGRGLPIVCALINGKKIPIVIADDQPAGRTVRLAFDLIGQEQSTPVALVFFNSLRWLMGDSLPATTREALTVDGWSAGQVTVKHPDGTTHTLIAEQGIVRDQTATIAGVYQLTQGRREVARAVNFFDPLESNTLDRVSTWAADDPGAAPAPSPKAAARRSSLPLAPDLACALLALLFIEWAAYSMKRRFGAKPAA